MKFTKIPGFGSKGVYVDDVDLMTITDEEWMEIGRNHLQNLVTIVRNCNCTPDRYGELMAKFGSYRPSTYTAKKYKERYGQSLEWVMQKVKEDSPLIDEDDKIRIRVGESVTTRTENGYGLSKVAGGYNEDGLPNGFFSDGELYWHSNESGTLTHAPGVSLLGYEKMIGSATCFLDTSTYYQDVSNAMRSELDDMIIIHRFIPFKIAPGNEPLQDTIAFANMCPEDDVEIPLVMKSPGGVVGLHMPLNTIYGVKGASQKESERILKELETNVFVEKYMYDHWYQSDNDLCIFDNSITQHRRIGKIDGRVGFRIQFDYSSLYDEPYQPYFQRKYQNQYNRKIREIVELAGVTDFKLPPKRLVDYIPFLRDIV